MGWVGGRGGTVGGEHAGNIYFNLENKNVLQLPGFVSVEAKAQPSKAVLSHRLLNNYF